MHSTRDQFRALMGRFVTGVTVIALDGDEDVVAMTANSVTAVSLDPLLVLVCIRNESRSLPLLFERGRFSVNVLAAGQAAVSQHYAGDRQNPSPARWSYDPQGTPLLQGANAAFSCKLESAHRIGDHTVVFGLVEGMQAPETPDAALLYIGGRYLDLPLTA